MNRPRAAAAVALVLAVLAGAGCAGDDDEPTTEAAAADTLAAAAATTTTGQSQLDTPGATAEEPGLSLEDNPSATSTIPPTTRPPMAADPSIAIGGADAEGLLSMALDPGRFAVEGGLVPNAGNPYHEIVSVDASFLLAIELYPEAGLAFDGTPGEWPTDCDVAGVCVYFDRDGTSGEEPLLVADPTGLLRIERIADGDYAVELVDVRFRADGGGGYHLAHLRLEV